MKVAEVTTNGRPGNIACRYTREALERWPEGTPLLSCSLPLRRTAHRDASAFFRGLLPEGQALQAMASIAGKATYDTFALLARFGRDVAGAVVIAETDRGDEPGEAIAYSPEELADDVAALDTSPLALRDDSELSLPGLQNKLTLIATPRGWARPAGGRPSTHILKAEDRRFPGMAAMEAACLRLAGAVGLTSVEVQTASYAGIDCLIVSRYDRRLVNGQLHRVHQEDACQALGRNAEANRGRGKYENAGGPSLREVSELFDHHSRDPVHELRRLVETMTFNVVIGNADAHGKNVSLLHDAAGTVVLAPLYDTVPTTSWPRLPTRAAMSVGGVTDLVKVTREALVREARSWRLSEQDAESAISAVATGTLAALDAVEVPDRLAEAVAARALGLIV